MHTPTDDFRSVDHVAHFDGACEPRNPGGWGGWGFAIVDASGVEIASDHGVLERGPDMTNNVAEYTAALECVRAWIALGPRGRLTVRGDSKLVIEQMCGRWAARKGAYLAVHRELVQLVASSGVELQWCWVSRDDNARADELSKQGLLARGIAIAQR